MLIGLERHQDKMSDTTAVLTLKQAAEQLRISKAYLCNVLNGKVPGVPHLRHAPIGRRILIKQEC